MVMNWTDAQLERYSRHILLDQVGATGQERLLASRVLIIGAGGLGSPAALYLAAAGIGAIGLVDADRVELSNLQRQVAHFTQDVGRSKVQSAAEKLRAINPDVEVLTHDVFVRATNLRALVRDYDFVIDGTDNFTAKFLINDACYFEQKPFSHAGILKFHGQMLTVLPGRSACYRCTFDAPPPPDSTASCSQAGILGVLAGVIGTLQATEALKYLLDLKGLLNDSLLTYDALTMTFRKITRKRNPGCRLCGEAPSITKLEEAETACCDLTKGCICHT